LTFVQKTATPIRRIGCGRPCEAGPLRFLKALRFLQKNTSSSSFKKNRNADPKDRLRQALRSRAATFFLISKAF
jgi:hypothetical protein